MVQVAVKRIYDGASPDDGYRVLVDRLWARGVSKEEADIDEWEKELAPSTELREWFHEDPDSRWNEFTNKYESELNANMAVSDFISRIKSKKKVTLLYASKDKIENNALVLKKYLENRL